MDFPQKKFSYLVKNSYNYIYTFILIKNVRIYEKVFFFFFCWTEVVSYLTETYIPQN